MSRFAFLIALFAMSSLAAAQATFEPATQGTDYGPPPPPPIQPWNFDVGINGGYSYVAFDHAKNNSFYDRSGPYLDANVMVPFGQSPFEFGMGLTASGYFASSNFFGVKDLYSGVTMTSFEPRLAWPIAIFGDSNNGLFITPRIGAGLLVDDYSVQTPFNGTYYFCGLAFEIRPAIQIGWRIRQVSFGLEAAYMAAWGSFGNFGSMANEGRAGLFFACRF